MQLRTHDWEGENATHQLPLARIFSLACLTNEIFPDLSLCSDFSCAKNYWSEDISEKTEPHIRTTVFISFLRASIHLTSEQPKRIPHFGPQHDFRMAM